MKETQIAKENVEVRMNYKESYEKSARLSKMSKDIVTNGYNQSIGKCKEHKQTCQRFLEFLENFPKKGWVETGVQAEMFMDIVHKMEDLQNAIKIYEDAGIK